MPATKRVRGAYGLTDAQLKAVKKGYATQTGPQLAKLLNVANWRIYAAAKFLGLVSGKGKPRDKPAPLHQVSSGPPAHDRYRTVKVQPVELDLQQRRAQVGNLPDVPQAAAVLIQLGEGVARIQLCKAVADAVAQLGESARCLSAVGRGDLMECVEHYACRELVRLGRRSAQACV